MNDRESEARDRVIDAAIRWRGAETYGAIHAACVELEGAVDNLVDLLEGDDR